MRRLLSLCYTARSVAQMDGNNMKMDVKARLIEIVGERSLITGKEMTLTSGATSRFYFDMKPTTFDGEGATIIGDVLLDAIENREVDYVAGLEMGALPVVMAAVLRARERGHALDGFCVRKEPKGHGTRRLVERELEPGAKVVVVEDVTTTGGSALKAAEAVREVGGEVSLAVTVVDRLEGARAALSEHGLELIALIEASDFDTSS